VAGFGRRAAACPWRRTPTGAIPMPDVGSGLMNLLSQAPKSGSARAVALLVLILTLSLISSPAEGVPLAGSGMNPVLLAQAGSSGVVFVLWSTTCNHHTCFRLERSNDGGRVFSLVKAPPISPGRGSPTGNLVELVFANPNDGYALERVSIERTALYATFDGGRSWRREEIRRDQRIEWMTSTPIAFYAVSGTCPDLKKSCGSWGLNRSRASASEWTGRSLPFSTRGMEPPQVAAYGSNVWITGQQQVAPYHALLATSHDNGRTFSVSLRPALSSVNGCGLDATSPSVVWAQCDQGNMAGDIPLSRDGGVHWITVSKNLTGNFAWGIFDPVSQSVAYFVNGWHPGRLYRIVVHDEKTEAIGRPPYPELASMVFTNASLGLALSQQLGPSGAQVLYRTSDGGAAWRRVIG
jgi:photosystem II stability/assembly factor-like uncharacterized protein